MRPRDSFAAAAFAFIAMLAVEALPEASASAAREDGETTGKRAYFMLGHNDVASPTFSSDFADYDLFVAPRELSADDIDTVHRKIPGARVLAYYGFSYVVVPGQCSPNCTDTPARCNMTVYPPASYFNASWALTDLDTGLPICVEPWSPATERRPWNQMIPFGPSADAIVRYWREVELVGKGWDGIYMDDYFSSYPPEWKTHITTVTKRFDVDGDGVPDSFSKLESQWEAWRQYLTRGMRDALGPDRLFVANAGLPAAADPVLNGITIEEEFAYCGGLPCGDNSSKGPPVPPGEPAPFIESVEAAFAGQGALTRAYGLTPLSVMWLTHPDLVPRETQCAEFAAMQRRMPWLVEGVDGAHLVCPRPAAAAAAVAAGTGGGAGGAGGAGGVDADANGRPSAR